jgi:peptidoglycan/xylan/chitin deacetylase (PgdA/CDA1 family)
MINAEAAGPVRDFVGYGATPPVVKWPGGSKIAVNLALNYEEGSEYAHGMGDGRNETLGEIAYGFPPSVRDLCVESVYEYGSRAGIWRVLRMLREYDVRSTVYAAAVALTNNPEVASAFVENGHEICGHGYRWEEVWTLSRDREKEHILNCLGLIEEVSGERPVGWYCRYGPSICTRELLVEIGGFKYDSDAYNDDLPYFVDVLGKPHLVVPFSMAYNDIRFIASPVFGAPDEFADLCLAAVAELRREADAGHPKMMSVGLHARWIGQAGRLAGLRRFVENCLATGDVWFATREEIADCWLAQHPVSE